MLEDSEYKKRCKICEEKKPAAMFYKLASSSDGLHCYCKDCLKSKSRQYRSDNLDKCLAYDRQRANLSHRVEARELYAQTPEGREAHRRAKDKWASENVIKRLAGIIVNNAIRAGRLKRLDTCQECGVTNKKIHGHHDNYDYPMVVRWLCPKCHSKWHKENGSGING